MDILKTVTVILFLCFSGLAVGYPEDLDIDSFTDEHPDGKTEVEKKKQEEEKKNDTANPEQAGKTNPAVNSQTQIVTNPDEFLCSSSEEYIRILKFLRQTQAILVTEDTARKIADVVSRSCDGGADRFAKVLVLLKSVGLSDKAAVKMALDFSTKPSDIQKNFIEIFTHSFLAEFFDYDYPTAVALAFELSKNYKGDPKQVRDDFIELVRFCKDGKKLDLPSKMCAEYTIKVARLSQYYPKGVRDSFYKLYNRFREDKAFAIDIKTALETTYGILKFGPRAEVNFFRAYDFAIAEDGLGSTQAEAVNFGLKMASRSFKGSEPPLFPASAVLRTLASEKSR